MRNKHFFFCMFDPCHYNMIIQIWVGLKYIYFTIRNNDEKPVPNLHRGFRKEQNQIIMN